MVPRSVLTRKRFFSRGFSRPSLIVILLVLTALVLALGIWAYSNSNTAQPIGLAGQSTQSQDAKPALAQTLPAARGDSEGAERPCLYGGLPKALSSSAEFKVLKNKGYTVGYSEKHKDPVWAAYRLFRVDNPPKLPRPGQFAVDERTEAHVGPGAYARSGYDRGHMAPNHAIATRYGQEAQLETFLMSNVCPQRPDLNRRVWQSLEAIEADDYARAVFTNHVVYPQ